MDDAALVGQARLPVAGEEERAVEVDEAARGASTMAGAMASEVPTMQPIISARPRAWAASASASASVRPPVLSSLMLMAS